MTDRDRLIELIDEYDRLIDCDYCPKDQYNERCGNECLADYLIAHGVTVGVAENAKTTDAVEVVRCKDCEYCSESKFLYRPSYLRCDHPNMEYDTECLDMWVEVEAVGFCSYGKRKVSE